MGETVRIASLVQKGIRSGRSSYVEMRALSRLTKQNIKTRVRNILPLLETMKASKTSSAGNFDAISEVIARIPSYSAEGYVEVLTPNGNFSQEALDKLLSFDADIVTCLAMLETKLKSRTDKIADSVQTVKEILQERKEFVDSLRA